MSHSRIYEVRTRKVVEEERITKFDYDFDKLHVEIPMMDYFLNSEAPREDDLEWLSQELERIGFPMDRDEITIGEDTAFLDEWKDAASDATEDLDLWKMRQIASGVYFSDMYIHDADNGAPIPLWAWAKDKIDSGEQGRTYYVGGILDYHF
jgi:hypothetical protein